MPRAITQVMFEVSSKQNGNTHAIHWFIKARRVKVLLYSYNIVELKEKNQI